jgi:hypothetical protein
MAFLNSKISSSFCILLLSFGQYAWADAPCEMLDGFSAIKNIGKSAEEIVRIAQIQEFKANPNEFCNQQLELRYLKASPRDLREKRPHANVVDQALNDGTLHDLTMATFKDNNKLSAPRSFYSQWDQTLIPLEELRKDVLNGIDYGAQAINRNCKFAERCLDGTIPLEEAVAILSDQKACLKSDYSDISGNLTEDSTYKANIPAQSMAEKYACAELLGVRNFNSCSSSFNTIKRISIPRANVTGLEIFDRVLKDGRYNEGLRKMALRVAKYAQEDNLKEESNVFADLKSSFRESGSSESDAEEMTWNTLGLLATSGANLSQRLMFFPYSTDQTQKRLALQVLSASLPLLDHRAGKKGRLYSFPKEISGSCNSGKSYHFWYAAYLARRATLEGKNPEAAAATSFQAEKAYQLLRGTMGNGNASQLASSPLFTPNSNIVRADLAYAGLGAVYGAQKATDQDPHSSSIDDSIEALMKNAGQGDAGALIDIAAEFKEKPFNTYKKWYEKFNPNIAFSSAQPRTYSKNIRTDYLEFEKNPLKIKCE